MLKIIACSFIACCLFSTYATAQSTSPHLTIINVETQNNAINNATQKTQEKDMKEKLEQASKDNSADKKKNN